MILRIPTVHPSSNVLLRVHWREQRRLQGVWDLWIKTAYRRLPEEERATYPGKVRVFVDYYFKVRRTRDKDRYSPTMILDALRHAGIIQDDNSEVCDVDWQIHPKASTKRETVITIEEG